MRPVETLIKTSVIGVALALTLVGGNASSAIAQPVQTPSGSDAPAPPSAAPTSGFTAQSFTLTATRQGASPTSSTQNTEQAAQDVISCDINVQRPHNSTHVPGNINIVVRATCSAQVNRIGIRAALYRNDLLVKDSGNKDVRNTRTAQNNAAIPCRIGNYQGWGSIIVDYPFGYVPSPQSKSNFGTKVTLGCS